MMVGNIEGGMVIEQIAKEMFITAVEQAPHAEWEHLFWEDMTDGEREPFREAARRICEILDLRIRSELWSE